MPIGITIWRVDIGFLKKYFILDFETFRQEACKSSFYFIYIFIYRGGAIFLFLICHFSTKFYSGHREGMSLLEIFELVPAFEAVCPKT